MAPECDEETAIATVLDRPTARADLLRPAPPVRASLADRPGIGRAKAWLIAGLLLWLLVGPRLDLPNTAGLRVEDLVFVALGVICGTSLRRLSVPLDLTLATAGVVVASLVSTIAADARSIVDPVTSVLYAVRPLEYWIALPAALLLFRAARGAWLRRIDALLTVVTVLQTGFAIAQYYFGIPVGFSHAAYTRAAGLTVGPYELGAISAMLIVYWIAHSRWTMASLATVAVAASISRISLLGAAAAVVVLAIAWLLQQRRRVAAEGWLSAFRLRVGGVRAAVQLASVTAAILVVGFTLGVITLPEMPALTETPSVTETPAAADATPTESPAPAEAVHSAEPKASETPTARASEAPTAAPSETPAASAPEIEVPVAPSESLSTRFASTSILGSWFIAGDLAAQVPRLHTSGQYDDVAYAHLNEHVSASVASTSGAEPSNLVRFFRWHLILDRFEEPVDFVLGLGPSFVGPSVDGSYLRFFADGGILGVLAWLAQIVVWLRHGPLWMRCVTITMLVGGLFIDILYAQRPMVLFWVLLALAIAVRDRAGRAPVTDPS